MMKINLKAKIILAIFSVTIIAGILATIISIKVSSDILIENKKNDVLAVATEQAHESAAIMNEGVSGVRELAKLPDVVNFFLNDSTTTDRINLVLSLMKITDKARAVYLIDKNGITLSSTDQRFVGQDYSFRSYFKKSIMGQEWQDYALGITSDEFGFYFSAPVKNQDGDILGVVVIKTEVDRMNEAVKISSAITKNAVAMLVDSNGFVVYSSKYPDRVHKMIGKVDLEVLEKIREEKKPIGNITELQYDNVAGALKHYVGPINYDFYDKKDYNREIISVVHIDGTDFYLVLENRYSDLVVFVNSFAILIALISGLVAVFSLMTLFFLMSKLLKPISSLVRMAKEIGKGNFGIKNTIKSGDEFQMLGDVLQSSSKELFNVYANLEKRVVERTRDLEDKTQALAQGKNALAEALKKIKQEQKKTEKLIYDLEKFKLAVDNAYDQVVITDPDGLVLYGNKSMERITGYGLKEVVGKKAGVLWHSPMSKEFYEKFWDTIKNKKQTFNGEITNHRKGGESYQAIISVSPVLDINNNIQFFVGIERDISDQKAAEEQIRQVLNNLQEQSQKLTEEKLKDEALFESIADGVFSTDQDGKITVLNKSAAQMLGWKEDELVGKSVVDVFKSVNEKGEEIPIQKRPIVLALSTGQRVSTKISDNYYYTKKDGTRFPVALAVTPFILDGKIVGTVEVFRDITLEKSVDQAKTEFVSLAPHQLRTPLTASGWYVEMLLSGDAGKITKMQKEHLQEVSKANQRMVTLVNSLLNVSRIELGTFAIDPTPTNVIEVAQDVLGELKPTIITKKLKVDEQFPKNLQLLNLDKNLIRIVFQNLLSNAVKYTPDKGKVTLKMDVDGDNLLVSISDTGCGIPDKDKVKIFGKLYRASNATALVQDGNGLGLYIVKAIVEQSAGGKVWFESVENKGTTFYFHIPLSGMKPKTGTKALT